MNRSQPDETRTTAPLVCIPSLASVRSTNLSQLAAILWVIASSSVRFVRATSAVSVLPARFCVPRLKLSVAERLRSPQ
jgi:hypothetical protein